MPMSQPAATQVVRPAKTAARLEREGDCLRLSYRAGGLGVWAAGIFGALWLTGWTAGCVALGAKLIAEPTLVNLLFALPFWAAWLFVFSMLVYTFARRERLSLDPDGLVYTRHAIVPLSARVVPLDEIIDFGCCQRTTNSDNGTTESGIELHTLGQPLQMAFGLSLEERAWLWQELNEHLELLRRDQAVAPAAPSSQPAGGETLALNRDPVDPPSDCSWEQIDDFDSVAFRERGKLQRPTLGMLLFINSFWNGIVSIFVALLWGFAPGGPQGGEWWVMFVFLIPFEAIGLVMFALLLAVILEPFRTITWSFADGQVECRLAWLGLGRTWVYPVERVERIELHRTASRETGNPFTASSLRRGLKAHGVSYAVSLVDLQQAEICRMEGLTQGEARWIGDVLLRERRTWFGHG